MTCQCVLFKSQLNIIKCFKNEIGKYFQLSVVLRKSKNPVPENAGTTARVYFPCSLHALLFMRMFAQPLAEVDFDAKVYFFRFIADALI